MTEALSLAGRRHSCSVIRSERSGDSNDRPCNTSAPRKQFQLVTRIAWQPSRAPARTKLKLSSGASVFRRQLSSRIVQPSRQPSSQLRRPAVTAVSSTSRTNVVVVLLIFPFFSPCFYRQARAEYSQANGLYLGFPICPPRMAPLYTYRQRSARNACSSQHRPASEAVSLARAAVRATEGPAFRALRRHRSQRVSVRSPGGRVARAARQPAGTGSAQIRRNMSPNSRRVRCPSASRSQ